MPSTSSDRDAVWYLENDFEAFFESLTVPRPGELDCSPPAVQTASASSPAQAAAGQGEGTIHPEKTGWDKMRDGRMVLAKGAGPGIWNRWVSHCAGHRIFWPFVHRDYLA